MSITCDVAQEAAYSESTGENDGRRVRVCAVSAPVSALSAGRAWRSSIPGTGVGRLFPYGGLRPRRRSPRAPLVLTPSCLFLDGPRSYQPPPRSSVRLEPFLAYVEGLFERSKKVRTAPILRSCHPGFWRFSGHIILVPLVTDDGSIAKISVMSRLHANGPRTKGE